MSDPIMHVPKFVLISLLVYYILFQDSKSVVVKFY